MSQGLPTTVLPPADPEARAALDAALALDGRATGASRSVPSPVAGRGSSTRWAELGDIGRDDIERYADYRVGYHRGLDALRANGWRGSGYVRWSAPTNRGFLRALAGLGARWRRRSARTTRPSAWRLFLAQLDPRGADPRRFVTAGAPCCAAARSRRMGTDKALIEVDGVPMAELVAGGARRRAAATVVLVGGDTELLARFGRPRRGRPLPGRGAGGRRVDRPRRRRRRACVVVASCDLPLLDAAAVAALVGALADGAAAAVAVTDRWQPSLTAWRTSARDDLEQAWEQGVRALHELVAAVPPCRGRDRPGGAAQRQHPRRAVGRRGRQSVAWRRGCARDRRRPTGRAARVRRRGSSTCASPTSTPRPTSPAPCSCRSAPCRTRSTPSPATGRRT